MNAPRSTAVSTQKETPQGWATSGHRLRHDSPAAVGQGPFQLDLEAVATGIVCGGATASAADRVLGLDLRATCPPSDFWVRGGDVTAVYEPADARRLRATAMWRLHPESAGRGQPWFACEVVASAQTSLLESDSALAVTADLAVGEPLWGCPLTDGRIDWIAAASDTPPPNATALLVRREATSVAVAVHPADVRRIETQRHDGRQRITCWLFTGATEQALEKGVLLRGRVFAAIGPAAADVVWAGAAIRVFNDSPPPLTT